MPPLIGANAGVSLLRIDPLVDGLHEVQLFLVEDGLCVGRVGLLCNKRRSATVRQLYVVPEARGRGLGKRLVEECCTVAAVNGCETLALQIARANAAVTRFYSKIGFFVAYQYDDGDLMLCRILKP